MPSSGRSKPLSIAEYEQYSTAPLGTGQPTSRASEYNRNYSSTSIAGHLSNSYGSHPLAQSTGTFPHGSGYSSNYPSVDNMSEIRASLANPAKSIWSAARETSQSLEFDVYTRRSNQPYQENMYVDGNVRSSSDGGEGMPQQVQQQQPQVAAPTAKLTVALERRLAKLEAENDKLRNNQEKLMRDKAKPPRPPKATSGTSKTLETAEDDLDHLNETEALQAVRVSVEQSLSKLSRMESEKRSALKAAKKELRDKNEEVARLSADARKVDSTVAEMGGLLSKQASALPPPVKRSKSPAKKNRSRTPSPTKLRVDTTNSVSFADTRGGLSPKKPPGQNGYTAPPPPEIPARSTKATELREKKRAAERKAMQMSIDEGGDGMIDQGLNGEFGLLAGADDPNATQPYTWMGPPLPDPTLEMRVSRQRDVGVDEGEVIMRRSKDFDALCKANVDDEGNLKGNLVVEDNVALDWSILMGTNDRKIREEAGELRKNDPTFEEVMGIASHCRERDRPSKGTLAILKEAELLAPPVEPKGDEATFKKKVSKLMLGLMNVLESNAEKQVKYVSFEQRCNLHKKDLEGILARRAMATMAYRHGAINSPRLNEKKWLSFMRAFWSEFPLRFPVTDVEVQHMWAICDAGDTSLLAEMVFVNPYIERNSFGFEFTQTCWGRPREGIMRLRSAGFETKITEDEIPARINYGYCKSTVAPPQDWDVDDIKRGMELPEAELKLDRVYGCLGKTICPNLYETHDGRVVFTAAAVAVVQSVETGAQLFYNHHCDDITCLTVHYAGRIAATGQMGKPCYALVWDIDTQETLYRIGDGFFERMVEALAISPNEKYLVGVGGDNNQSFGVWDLKAVDESGVPCPAMVSEGSFSPGVPPMLTFLEWQPGGDSIQFVGIAKGKMLRFFNFEPDKEGAGVEGSGVQALTDFKGVAPRAVREFSSAAWAMDGRFLATGTDLGDVLIWTGSTITSEFKACTIVKKSDKVTGSLPMSAITALAFTPEGDKLYTGGADGKLKVWSDFEDEEPTLLDTHNMALTRAELASKCGGPNAQPHVKKMKARGIPGAPKPAVGKVDKIIPANKAIKNIIVLDNKKVVKSIPPNEEIDGEFEQVVIGTERGMLLNVWDGKDGNTCFRTMMCSHYGEVSGLSPHPLIPGCFATVGEDGILNIWSALEKKILKTRELPHPARNCVWSPDGAWIAVGYCDGYVGIYDTERLAERVEHNRLKSDVDRIKWSPDGRWLACGSHDNYIDIHDCAKGFKFRNRFKGHTSYITGVDFSTDSRMLMTTCGASEILYWDVVNKKQLRAKADMPNDPNDPVTWGRLTCVLGFPVMGIWPDFADGTDVNAVHVSEKGDILVSCDDFGEVKLFNFPTVVEDGAFRAYRGHSSFVNNVSFVKGDTHVISCGSADLAVLQWKYICDRDVLKPMKDAVARLKVVNAFAKETFVEKKKDRLEKEKADGEVRSRTDSEFTGLAKKFMGKK